jgi:hypothetical protein
LVEEDGFEPTSPREQIYSLPRPAVCAVPPYLSTHWVLDFTSYPFI